MNINTVEPLLYDIETSESVAPEIDSAEPLIRKFRYSSILKKKLIENNKHQFAQEHGLRLYKSNAIYTFIPKNACSTMRLSLAFYNGTVDDISDFEWIDSNNSTFQADLASLSSASYTFVILRCPYSRLASFYLDKIVNYQKITKKLYRQLCQLHGGILGKIGRFQFLKKVYSKSYKNYINSLSFYDFVKSLKQDRIKKGDQHWNHHWRPQVNFLVYKDYDDWFCLEEFSKAITTLKDKINLDVIDARKLTSHGTDTFEKVHDEGFSTLPSSVIREMRQNGKCPSLRSLYNDELIEAVNEIYSEDIAIYQAVFGNKNLMFF